MLTSVVSGNATHITLIDDGQGHLSYITYRRIKTLFNRCGGQLHHKMDTSSSFSIHAYYSRRAAGGELHSAPIEVRSTKLPIRNALRINLFWS